MPARIDNCDAQCPSHPRTPFRLIGGLSCALLVAACASENTGTEPPQLASIAVSLASSSIGVGQSQALAGQARDQYGAAMSGISFTWASSSGSVATVDNGVVTGVSAGTTNITASSGGVTSSPVALTVVVVAAGQVVINKASVFLPAVGETAQLTAQLVSPQGAASPVTATWTSSAPGKVSVEPTGQLVARSIGSAQIFAQAGGARSVPTLVTVAEPQSGALVVTDVQVVSVGPPLNVAPGTLPGVGTNYEVTLQGVAAPAPGAVVLAAETAPIAGKVVATRQEAAGLVVTLQLAPLHQLFRTYDISWVIELAAFPAEALASPSAQRTLGASWNAARRSTVPVRAARLAALEPFRAFDCGAEIKPQLIDAPIQLSLQNSLNLVIDDRPGYSKHALEGSATLTGNAGLKLKAGFRASGKCEAQAQLRLPIFGWVSLLVMPAVRFGLGAEVKGEIKLVQGELGVTGKIGFSPVLGWECGGATPACRALDGITSINDLKTKSRIPSENDVEAKISAQFYVLAGLDASLLAGLLNAEILEARVGPEQAFDLAFEDDQAALTDYAASYDLKLQGVVEPGGALKKAIEAVIDDDATGVSFAAEFSTDISESPKGTLTASASLARPDQPVDFTVELTPATVAYFLLDYNVTGVELYRKRDDELAFTPWKSMSLIASNRATYRWVPQEADAGKYEFAAFVNTQLVTPLLEVAPNSIKAVEVSCFSGGASSATSAVQHSTSVCSPDWIGTTSTIFADDLPLYRVESQVRFKYDAAQSALAGPQIAIYYAEGQSVFTPLDPCYSLTPTTVTWSHLDMRGSGGTLRIDFAPDVPTWIGAGGVAWQGTITDTCNPESDPVASILPAAWLSGRGSLEAPAFARFAGTNSEGGQTFTFSFDRVSSTPAPGARAEPTN